MSQTDICIRRAVVDRAVVDDASNPRAPKLCTNGLESTTLSPPRRAHHSKRRYFLWSTLMHHLRHIDTIRCKHYRASLSSPPLPSGRFSPQWIRLHRFSFAVSSKAFQHFFAPWAPSSAAAQPGSMCHKYFAFRRCRTCIRSCEVKSTNHVEFSYWNVNSLRFTSFAAHPMESEANDKNEGRKKWPKVVRTRYKAQWDE